MSSTNSYVYINDDEVELKQIIIRYGNLRKMRKFNNDCCRENHIKYTYEMKFIESKKNSMSGQVVS